MTERAVIRFLLKVGPWLAPVGTVFAVQRAVIKHFDFPIWAAWPTAIVIEILGIGTIYLMLVFDDWNRRRSENSRTPKARAGLARFLVLLYIATTVTLVILLDVLPNMTRWALAILPIVSVVAYLALSLFAEFEYMEGEKVRQKKERKEHRQHVETTVATVDSRVDTDELLRIYAMNGTLSLRQAGKALGVSHTAVGNRLKVLETQGRIKRNGNGVEVI